MEEQMKKLVLGLVLAAFATAPALADKKKMKNSEADSAGMKSAEVGRGGLKEWPVSKEEADWSSAAASSSSSSSSTGASSGESGANGSR
jgi:hypothetical protein